MSLHRARVHPIEQPECWGCKISTLQLSVGPPPGASDERHRQRAFQHRFAAEFSNGDREAYRELRRQGYQPPRIAGSAQLATRASTRFEIESGQIMTDQKALSTVMTMCADSGVDPLTPATTPRD